MSLPLNRREGEGRKAQSRVHKRAETLRAHLECENGLVLPEEVFESGVCRDVIEVELTANGAHAIREPIVGRRRHGAWASAIEECEVLTETHIIAKRLIEVSVLHWWREQRHIGLTGWRQVSVLHAGEGIVAAIVEANSWRRLLHRHIEVIRHAIHVEQRLVEREVLWRQSIVKGGVHLLWSWREV